MEYDPRPQYGYGEGETVYTYDANNRMITSKYNYDNYMNEDHTYTYDNNGNLKSDYSIVFYDDFAPADGTHIVYHEGTENYIYDNLNRLKRYSGEIYADYAYDPTGMRISKKLENENQINYVWSGGNIIGEYGIDGSKTYLRGAGGEIVKTKDGNSEERYFAYNAHGDTTSIIEKDPESVSFGVTATYEYDAFGNELKGSETGETHENSFRYNGQQVDEESGLIYLRNRYYNPEIGRFITEDPAKDGTNWYVYCGNNPIAFVDPNGLTITLIGTDEERKKSLEQLQMLTNDELYMDPETGVVTIVENGNMNIDKTLIIGSEMIFNMINNSEFDGQIQRSYLENNGCWVEYTDGGAIITMNDWAEEGGNWFYEVSNEKGEIIYEDHQNVSYIILGHELIHATHHMNDTVADSSRVVYRYTDEGLVADIRNDMNMSEEYNTTGLYHVVELPNPNGDMAIRKFHIPWPGSFTENALRAEHGLRNRVAY